LPIAECNLQHAHRPIARTAEAMPGIGRNPDLIACLALTRIFIDLDQRAVIDDDPELGPPRM